MATFKCFASLVLAATIVPAHAAETSCPGNAASVPLRFVNRYQIVPAVSISHTGPYKFLLSSSTQITMTEADPRFPSQSKIQRMSVLC